MPVIAARNRLPNECPRQAFAFGEAVAEQIGHQRFVVGERDQTVANVAGRQHAEFFLQAAGRAAVVAHGYDRGEIARAPLEPAQQRRKPGAAADGDDLVSLLQAQPGECVVRKPLRPAPARRCARRTQPHAHARRAISTTPSSSRRCR